MEACNIAMILGLCRHFMSDPTGRFTRTMSDPASTNFQGTELHIDELQRLLGQRIQARKSDTALALPFLHSRRLRLE